MRNQPTYEAMMKTIDSKYALVVLTAKRARQLNDGGVPQVDSGSSKPVTVAMLELKQGLLDYDTPQARN